MDVNSSQSLPPGQLCVLHLFFVHLPLPLGSPAHPNTLMCRRKPQKTMPYVADSPELLTPANDGIVAFHQLPGVNHAGNMGSMTGLQIPWIVPIRIVFIPSITLF